MQVITDAAHPVMAGMPERADVTVYQPPGVHDDSTDSTAPCSRSFPADVSPLRSGFFTPGGDKFIQGFAAALDVKHGKGHVVLFAFNPNWRGQPTGTFRMVFNSLFFGKDVADQAKGTPGFWTAPASLPTRADSTRPPRPGTR